MDKSALKARDIEALTFIYQPTAQPPPSAATTRRGLFRPTVTVVATAAVLLITALGYLLTRL
jgi:hypothetical protein